MAKVDVDFNHLRQSISTISRKTAKEALMNQMLTDMQPLVPNDEGILQQTGVIDSTNDSLIWQMPYAKAQFYGTNGKAVFSNYTTPGTGKRWDLVAAGMYMSDWERVYLRGLGL